MERFYGMVRVVHRHALDHSFWPDMTGIESAELNQIMAACHGSKWAVNRLEVAARKEMLRRGESQWHEPLRLVPDPDPLKNKVDI
jgi:hypothetical protein